MKPDWKINRRSFIKTTSVVAPGLFIVPSQTISGLGHETQDDKLNIAGAGTEDWNPDKPFIVPGKELRVQPGGASGCKRQIQD